MYPHLTQLCQIQPFPGLCGHYGNLLRWRTGMDKEEIPVSSKWVQVDLLHPTLKHRLVALFRHPEIRGRMVVCSGVRSYAEQKRLYDGYRAGKKGFNLAANPDWQRPDGYFFGSFHQAQPDGYGYAVDFRITDKKLSTGRANELAQSFGLRPTVKGEWWHHQPRDADGWFPSPAFDSPPTPKIDFAAIAVFIQGLRVEVSRKPLRLRRSKGKAVEVAQRQLGAKGYDAGPPDGKFGWRTRRETIRFQRASGLTKDGVIGLVTWDNLMAPEADKDDPQDPLF